MFGTLGSENGRVTGEAPRAVTIGPGAFTDKEIVHLQPTDVVPSVEDLHPGSVAVLEHNTPDLLTIPDEGVRRRVLGYYGSRVITHLYGSRGGDVAYALTDADNADACSAYAGYIARHTGIKIDVITELSPGVTEQACYVPYYPSARYSERRLYGIDPAQAQLLRDKSSFANVVRELNGELGVIAREYDVYGNMVLPHETVAAGDHLLQGVRSKVEHIQRMYAEARSVDESLDYPIGVVVQNLGGDGGYGTMFLTETQDGKWHLSGCESHNGEYDSLDDALAALQAGAPNGETQYKITRLIDVAMSPSVHVYVEGDKVIAMPVTYQLMKDNSCVGGGAENAVEEGTGISDREKRLMQRASELVMTRTLGSDSHAGIAGFDFIRAGQREDHLRTIIQSDSRLQELYGEEVTEKGFVECNPRHTAISSASWPAIMYMVHRRVLDYQSQHPGSPVPDEVRQVSYGDIETMYGKPDAEGRVGSFFTFDKIAPPEGVTNEQALVDWMDWVNAQLEGYGIFVMPRIKVHLDVDDEGRNVYETSVILGMLPESGDALDERLGVFRQLIKTFRQSGDLTSLSVALHGRN